MTAAMLWRTPNFAVRDFRLFRNGDAVWVVDQTSQPLADEVEQFPFAGSRDIRWRN